MASFHCCMVISLRLFLGLSFSYFPSQLSAGAYCCWYFFVSFFLWMYHLQKKKLLRLYFLSLSFSFFPFCSLTNVVGMSTCCAFLSISYLRLSHHPLVFLLRVCPCAFLPPSFIPSPFHLPAGCYVNHTQISLLYFFSSALTPMKKWLPIKQNI